MTARPACRSSRSGFGEIATGNRLYDSIDRLKRSGRLRRAGSLASLSDPEGLGLENSPGGSGIETLCERLDFSELKVVPCSGATCI